MAVFLPPEVGADLRRMGVVIILGMAFPVVDIPGRVMVPLQKFALTFEDFIDDAAVRAAGYLKGWVDAGWIAGLDAPGMSW
ncbi:MAG: hypothetical protein VW268_12565 [Rhodospirillaceae bacterium]